MALRHIHIFIALFFCGFLALTGCKQQSAPQAPSVQSFPELSPELDTALNQRLDAFEATFVKKDMGGLVEYMPPKIFESLLVQSNLSKEDFKKQLDLVWKQTEAILEIKNFKITRDQKSVKLAEGGRPYKVLPTQVDMRFHETGKEAVAVSETLAFFDKGQWYVLRLDEPQMVALLKTAYPDVAEIEIMKPIMKIDGKLVQP